MHEIKNFRELCVSLAVEMTARTGELWRVIEHPEKWTHIESPSACLLLRDDWRTHRLAIRATAPHGTRERNTGESITCDPTRKPEAIARDIENRLLQHARAHLIESVEYHTARTKAEIIQKLREKMIQRYCPKRYNDKFASEKMENLYKERVWASLTCDDLVHIEVNLPFAKALKLLNELTQGE